MSASLRSTQRAPRSCRFCASRKVKCDKSIPCTTCIRRGEAANCTRETVLVRGRVTTARDADRIKTYDELLRENTALREAAGSSRQKRADPATEDDADQYPKAPDESVDGVTRLFKMRPCQERRRHMTWNDIVLPGRDASARLVQYGKTWNSWVHYALDHPRFEKEHSEFLEGQASGKDLSSTSPSWLAIYFGVLATSMLTMDDQSARSTGLPSNRHRELFRNWYEAALYCLEEADFLRRPDVRTVQTVAILGICFHNFGDHDLCQMLWTCAIRISLRLGLNQTKHDPSIELPKECCTRLWWTLVICDWLPFPGYSPMIRASDVHELPAFQTDEEHISYDGTCLYQVAYHVFMARTATVYHSFWGAIRQARLPRSEIIRHADEQLAQVITTLPEHLQPESGEQGASMSEIETVFPWLRWQRVNITLVLLAHRLIMHATLRSSWRENPEKFHWAKVVCLNSAKDIIWISQNWELPTANRRHWALTFQIFQAAMVVIGEAGAGDASVDALFGGNWKAEVGRCLDYFEEIREWNAVAAHAADALKDIMLRGSGSGGKRLEN